MLEEMVRRRVLGRYYISHWSVWMDLQITARTQVADSVALRPATGSWR